MQQKGMCDIEKLIDNTFPIIEGMLKRSGNFPLQVSAIKHNGLYTRITTCYGAEQTSTTELVTELKKALRKKTGFYRSVAIFSDMLIVDPDTSLQIRAIEVYIEAKNEMSAYIFYYPYSLPGNKEVRFGNTWSQITRKEIINKIEVDPQVQVFIEKPELKDNAITGRKRRSAIEKFWGQQSSQAKRSTS